VSKRLGPFPDIESFYQHILWKVKMIAGESKASLLLEKLESLKFTHLPSVVFTHSDLAPRNIILSNNRVSGIIDWEQSGWWPYWWEYVKALYSIQLYGDERVEWIRFVESVLDVYDEEKTINEEIRCIEGFPY
jgi:aminoglycoside phosphotransferase (APT) family kinase protein